MFLKAFLLLICAYGGWASYTESGHLIDPWFYGLKKKSPVVITPEKEEFLHPEITPISREKSGVEVLDDVNKSHYGLKPQKQGLLNFFNYS